MEELINATVRLQNDTELEVKILDWVIENDELFIICINEDTGDIRMYNAYQVKVVIN